jgi:hypothetical protein
MKRVSQKSPLLRLGILIALASILSVAGFQQVNALKYNESSSFLGGSQLFPEPPKVNNQYIRINIEGFVAVKPLKISKYTDLTQGLKLTDEQTIVFIVHRSGGLYEQYLFPANFQGDVKTNMSLLKNDEIIYSNPLRRPRTTPVPLGTIVPSTNLESPSTENQSPYPAPLNSNSIDQLSKAPNPYP